MNSKNKYENNSFKRELYTDINKGKEDYNEKKAIPNELTFKKRITNKIISTFDYFFIKYLTVERSRNRRKLIWKTKSFREIVFLHIPRMLFVFGMVYACHKINYRAKKFKNYLTNEVDIKSEREDNIETQQKEIDYFLRLPNDFDPNKKNNALSVEFKDVNKYNRLILSYEYNKLNNEELERLEEVNDWVENLNSKYKF